MTSALPLTISNEAPLDRQFATIFGNEFGVKFGVKFGDDARRGLLLLNASPAKTGMWHIIK